MTNKRITELTALDGDDVANDDLLMIVDVSDSTMAATGTNKKITVAEFATDSTLGGAFVAKSTLTTDGDMLTRASGVPDRITRADLAQDSAFSSRYKPLASDRIWLNANEFVVLGGSPSLGTLNSGATAHERTGVYLFDASTGEAVGAAFAPPPGWTTFTANIYWSNAGAGSGDVVWGVFGLALGDGDSSASVLWQGSDVTATAPAQNVVEVTAAGTTFTVSSGKIHRINLRRSAVAAADTLANDAALIGIELVRAS